MTRLRHAAVAIATCAALTLIALATAHTAAIVPRLDRPPTMLEQRATVRAELKTFYSERK